MRRHAQALPEAARRPGVFESAVCRHWAKAHAAQWAWCDERSPIGPEVPVDMLVNGPANGPV